MHKMRFYNQSKKMHKMRFFALNKNSSSETIISKKYLFGPTIVRSYEFSAVHPSFCLSVCLSVRPSVRPSGFFWELKRKDFSDFLQEVKGQ